ncbi:RecQ family ATP-dependent DNA helicase [Sporolactobacillus terrae]|uniref:ATP-dependent DNA helicase RecQ n=1 Tax=Sporolactobacillus terrae TaxID=269673 RepID=A0A410D959_9BACL|nr:ATP-dependent DNA helicase RecQ [Sporolactobacillus terrae]QAA22638.1 ATP-dependent DNA helicase RecQ [Sporolactobacillus terrae]QAA25612.1 ATP-dependent DNA helicase RecQ [Sporolactobacillus terrae]UAK17421.1 ATP-dependent DNA helicase [Sporolactobacillus terrae]BBN98965.1 putative ATP-dependent DNA helicase RecS [Sporolactobacillus terrae]
MNSNQRFLKQAQTILKKQFGHEQFRPGQEEIILNVLNGKDVFAMMPTGSGKSLCYQIPGYLLQGTVLIISPLLSLMEDQVHALRLTGEKNVRTLNGLMHPLERSRVLRNLRSLRFLYLSPEMLRAPAVMKALSKITIALFVVDEAHCVSQWGHDFRPDYMHLADIRAQLGQPPCLAVTATADEHVRHDVVRSLNLTHPAQIIMSVDRKNIAIIVQKTANQEEKTERLFHLLEKAPYPGIIYCASRDWTERLAEQAKQKLGLRTAFYHGGMASIDRRKIQNQFLDNQIDLLCCTNAFGMGINKPDIRLIVHFHFPSSMNAYLQEIGRASRDGKQGLAVLFYTKSDEQLPEGFIDGNFPSDETLRRVLLQLDQGTRSLADKNEFMNVLMEEGVSETAARFLFEHASEKPMQQTYSSLLDPCRMRIKERVAVQVNDLSIMKNYLETSSCRRRFYLQVYHEKLQEKPAYCCDRCRIPLSELMQKIPKKKRTEPLRLMDWKQKLAALFQESERSPL